MSVHVITIGAEAKTVTLVLSHIPEEEYELTPLLDDSGDQILNSDGTAIYTKVPIS